MGDTALNPAYERAIEQDEASRRLGLRIERGDRAGRHYALTVRGETVFVVSRAPIEFAVRRDAA